MDGRRSKTVGRWRIPSVDEDDVPEAPTGPFRSPTLNINISFPRTVDDGYVDSSAESSGGETYFQQLWLQLSPSGHRKQREDGGTGRRSSPERQHSAEGWGGHKKRIITPPRRLRSNLLRNKKQRLEKAKNRGGAEASPSKSTRSSNSTGRPQPARGVPTERPAGDDRHTKHDFLCNHLIVTPEKGERRQKKQSAVDHPKPRYVVSDSDDDSDTVFRLPQRKSKGNARVLSEDDHAIPSTSSGVRRAKVNEDDDKEVEMRRWLPPRRAATSASSWSHFVSSDDDESNANQKTRTSPKKPAPVVVNDDSSDSDVEYSWVGPSPRSRPSTSVSPVAKSKKDVASTAEKLNRGVRGVCQRDKAPLEDSVVVVSPVAASQQQRRDEVRKKRGPATVPQQHRWCNRYSSDADSSSSSGRAGTPPIVRPSRLNGRRSRAFNVRNRIESGEEAVLVSPPPYDDRTNIAPDSPGMADALLRIEQIEADEALARRLEFELNAGAYSGEGVVGSEEQMVGTAFVAPQPHTSSGGNSRAAQNSYPKRNPYTRAVGGRPPVHNAPPPPPPQTRSTPNRIPRSRLRRYPHPMSLLDSPMFSDNFDAIDDRLRVFISSLESDEDVDAVLALNRPNRAGGREENQNQDELDQVIQAVINGNEVGQQRQAVRNRTAQPRLRRRSPRGHRQLRSTYALVPILMNDGADYEDLLAFEERLGHVSVGMSRSQIHRLPTKQYVLNGGVTGGGGGVCESNGEEEEDNCHICLCDYAQGESLRILPCFHEFHSSCIDQWLQVKDTCPICRMQVQVD